MHKTNLGWILNSNAKAETINLLGKGNLKEYHHDLYKQRFFSENPESTNHKREKEKVKQP